MVRTLGDPIFKFVQKIDRIRRRRTLECAEKRVFVIHENADLVAEIVPDVGGKPDVKAERIHVKTFEFQQDFADPLLVPR